jgi:hypothetical protein
VFACIKYFKCLKLSVESQSQFSIWTACSVTVIYYLQNGAKSGHTDHPSNRICLFMEGGHFEYLKQNSIYVLVKTIVRVDTKSN